MAKFQCQQCGTVVPYDEVIPRDSECESCRRDLRCCMNCRHYDPSRNNSCRETEAELVEDKARRNFCEFFAFNPAPFAAGRGQGDRQAAARAKLEGLFGGGPAGPALSAKDKLAGLFGGVPPATPGDPRRKLDDLFRKKPPDEE
jgi:hypothetical protein